MTTLYILQMYYQHNINPKIILLRQPEIRFLGKISSADFVVNTKAQKNAQISAVELG